MNTNEIRITNSEGDILEYTVLFTFDANGKSYVAYTDTDIEKEKEMKVYYASYKVGDLTKLEQLESQEEIALMDEMMDEYEDIIKKM